MMKKTTAILAGCLLAACTPMGSPVADRCPATGILREAEEVTVGPIEASIANFRGACRPSQHGGLDVELEIDFTALAAPEADNIKLPYFVAILSPNEEIVQRLTFEVETDINVKGVSRVTESHDIHIPATTAEEAALYRVAIGYILTSEQQQRLEDAKNRKTDAPQP